MFAVAFQSISERKWGKTYDYTHLCRNYKIFWILTGIAILLSISALALFFSENKQDYSLLSTVEETTENITDFSFNQTKEEYTVTEKYAYSIGNGNYELYSDSEDIYSIKMNSSKPNKVTVQKNKYRSNITFKEKEMYYYIFE
ncbi:hypothetical protein [Ruminococcus intestinalis]|uniref:hypothetical protein n=1 Tax=Ruminococcus intestinalis TaxID=2763066 RepID=UPI003F81F2C8